MNAVKSSENEIPVSAPGPVYSPCPGLFSWGLPYPPLPQGAVGQGAEFFEILFPEARHGSPTPALWVGLLKADLYP